MPKIDMKAAQTVVGTLYPPPYDKPCRPRVRQKLGDAANLDQFGVNLLTLPPGAWSSQRHWHTKEDEFVYVLSGKLILTEPNGTRHEYVPGDSLVLPIGYTGTWEMQGNYRELVVLAQR